MFDRKELAYLSQHGILIIRDCFSMIIVGRLTSYNLYKINLFEATNKLSAQLAFTKIDFSRAITAGTSKSATNVFI